MQPVDSDEFAPFVAACVSDGRGGEREDFAGPQELTLRELAEQYMAARGRTRRIWNAPLPGRIASTLEAGSTSSGALRGTTSWAEWLRRSSAQAAASS